jgi:Saxitoxin biosynthesis operon protein SxtJ
MPGSERSFGLVFATFFAVISLTPLLRHPAGPVRLWGLAIAAVFLVLALTWTAPLRPLNWLWFRVGLLLHAIVTPVIMGLLFYSTMTPIGLLMRLAGKDPLRVRRDVSASSYWIPRDPPGPAPETMKNQF